MLPRLLVLDSALLKEAIKGNILKLRGKQNVYQSMGMEWLDSGKIATTWLAREGLMKEMNLSRGEIDKGLVDVDVVGEEVGLAELREAVDSFKVALPHAVRPGKESLRGIESLSDDICAILLTSRLNGSTEREKDSQLEKLLTLQASGVPNLGSAIEHLQDQQVPAVASIPTYVFSSPKVHLAQFVSSRTSRQAFYDALDNMDWGDKLCDFAWRTQTGELRQLQ
eukprot:TRINITY_DN557_c0_g2_i1.p1 TRINITY_DN557_c0_g2~~TRINITY_DN557_c0_g2_i1.p1  ORF type:complete len:231 (+),score=44.66 TRINITY_DN557_c0_g2_i1:23-694(+)